MCEHMRKILRTQMLIYPTLFPPIPPSEKKIKRCLQNSYKYCHQAGDILTDLEPIFLVFSGQLGLECVTTEIKG